MAVDERGFVEGRRLDRGLFGRNATSIALASATGGSEASATASATGWSCSSGAASSESSIPGGSGDHGDVLHLGDLAGGLDRGSVDGRDVERRCIEELVGGGGVERHLDRRGLELEVDRGDLRRFGRGDLDVLRGRLGHRASRLRRLGRDRVLVEIEVDGLGRVVVVPRGREALGRLQRDLRDFGERRRDGHARASCGAATR